MRSVTVSEVLRNEGEMKNPHHGRLVHGGFIIVLLSGINDFDSYLFCKYEGVLIYGPFKNKINLFIALFMFKFGTCTTSLINVYRSLLIKYPERRAYYYSNNRVTQSLE